MDLEPCACWTHQSCVLRAVLADAARDTHHPCSHPFTTVPSNWLTKLWYQGQMTGNAEWHSTKPGAWVTTGLHAGWENSAATRCSPHAPCFPSDTRCGCTSSESQAPAGSPTAPPDTVSPETAGSRSVRLGPWDGSARKQLQGQLPSRGFPVLRTNQLRTRLSTERVFTQSCYSQGSAR